MEALSRYYGPGYKFDISQGLNAGQSTGDIILFYKATRPCKLPANFSTSHLYCQTAPSQNMTYTVYKNVSSVGSGAINADQTVGSFSVGGGVTLAIGDTLLIVADQTNGAINGTHATLLMETTQ